MPCYVMPCYVVLCSVMRCSVVLSCSVLSCHVVSCSVMPCSVMLCSVMLCSVLSCSSKARGAGSSGIIGGPGGLAAAVCRAGGPGGLFSKSNDPTLSGGEQFCFVVLCYAMLEERSGTAKGDTRPGTCNGALCYAMFMLCYVYVMLCYGHKTWHM